MPETSEGATHAARFLPLAGRLLVGGGFVISGATKIPAYVGVTAAIAGAGLPLAPLGYALALIIEGGLGTLLILGYRTRPAALCLAIWCIVTAVIFHRDFIDQNTTIHFIKNLMIAGGLLQLVRFGAGALSLDNGLDCERGAPGGK